QLTRTTNWGANMTNREGELTDEVMSVIPSEVEPHRRWHTADVHDARADLELLLLASNAHDVFAKLMRGEKTFSAEEIITLGELNFRCWLQGYEPIAILISGMPVRLNTGMDAVLDEALASKIVKRAE
ncbi:hypothetical protein ACTXN6_11745, partial [Corynebacterium casei]